MSLLSSAQMLTCDMNKSQQNYMMSRTVAEQEIMNLRKELSDAHAKLKNAANAVALEAEQRSNQKVSYVARQYEERYSELKMNLTMSHLIEAEFKVHAIDSLAYLAHLRGV